MNIQNLDCLRVLRSVVASSAVIVSSVWLSTAAAGSFVNFESGQVRPLALSVDRSRLYAVNTPDNRLEIFAVGARGLSHISSVPVGMEPVAVALNGDNEVWVVNHLSDSISVVDVSSVPPRVTQTLLVGDEPRDIVFAGPGRSRAFITTARRGQNSPTPYNPFTTVGRADVWVFDADDIAAGNKAPLTIVNMFGDTPRALAVSNDGSKVYAAVFMSGNQTTVLRESSVNGDMPAPTANIEGIAGPDTSLIVRQEGGQWLDGADRDWTSKVRVSLPDYDVFTIDANADTPVEIDRVSGVGTTLFNMAVNPVTDTLYVSNLEARNGVRFEGPGIVGGSTVRGHIAESRITVIKKTANGHTVLPVHLNNHIDYSTDLGTPEEKEAALAFPTGMAMTANGQGMYFTAFGSDVVRYVGIRKLENDRFPPNIAQQIAVPGGGPTGIVLDEPRHKAYVLTRFNNSVQVVNFLHKTAGQTLPMHTPEPPEVINGRRFLYDARYTSSRGDSACASCHIFGDTDHLSWDLGNPDDVVALNPNEFVPGTKPRLADISFHPMKGPMTTQSLRGLKGMGPQHWRGDRTGIDGTGDPIEMVAFRQFQVAFPGLVGRESPLPAADMQAFADFALTVVYPPNPIRALDNSRTDAQQRGHDYFFTQTQDGTGNTCNECHTLSPTEGFFGTSGKSIFRGTGTPSDPTGIPMKVPHYRNLYTKVGFFSASSIIGSENPVTKDQIRGFGFRFDGASESLLSFLGSRSFVFPEGEPQKRDVVRFMAAIDSDMAPIVGQQVTLGQTNRLYDIKRVRLLDSRASVTSPREECDLIVKGPVASQARGWTRLASGDFRSDRLAEDIVTLGTLISLSNAPNSELTFTCTPPGSGVRMGIDRDEDGVFDRDELDAGSDPDDPSSIPA